MMRKIVTAELSEHHITKPEVSNPRHNKNTVLLFLVIATTNTITLSVPTIIMISAQGSSSGNNNDSSGSNGTDKQQMGICVIGVRSPCNGNK